MGKWIGSSWEEAPAEGQEAHLWARERLSGEARELCAASAAPSLLLSAPLASKSFWMFIVCLQASFPFSRALDVGAFPLLEMSGSA